LERGVGVGEDASLQIAQALGDGVLAGHDEVGTVAGFTLPDGDGNQSQPLFLTHEGVAANPGEIDVALHEFAHDLPVTCPLHEAHGLIQAQAQIGGPLIEEADLIVEENRGGADA